MLHRTKLDVSIDKNTLFNRVLTETEYLYPSKMTRFDVLSKNIDIANFLIKLLKSINCYFMA